MFTAEVAKDAEETDVAADFADKREIKPPSRKFYVESLLR
jgi:hypothetical protein